jgi:hypothetical protein
LEVVRDRLTTTFGVQVARGLLHGDPHEGNFFVLPDGKTIGLIDYGLAIEMGMFDAAGPAMLLSAAFFQNPRRMAEAMLGMSTQSDMPKGPEREAIIDQLTEDYDRILRDVADDARRKQRDLAAKPFLARMKASVTGRFDRTLDVSKRALELVIRTAALAPSARHLQALKATFSMGGNLAQLEKEGLGAPKWKRGLRLFKNITLQLALAPFAGRRARKQRSAEIEQIKPIEAPRNVVLERLEHSIQSGAPD